VLLTKLTNEVFFFNIYSKSSPLASQPLKTGQISCPKISVTNYQSMLHNIPEQQWHQYCSILQYHIQYMDFNPHHINSNIKIPHTYIQNFKL